MTVFWGDDLLDTTQGLDILGVRGIDQAVEMSLVNGITTISQRARYLSILPWALGDYMVGHASEAFDWDNLLMYLRRIEFVTLAATRLDREINGSDAGGALGANLHRDRLGKLLEGEAVTFPDDQGGAMLGTYLAPCRALGLLVDGDEGVPYRLSPRGKKFWEIKQERLKASPVMIAINNQSALTRELAETAIADFSLGSLSSSVEETDLLKDAVFSPWHPDSNKDQIKVARAYESINGTIEWANSMLAAKPDSAAGLIVRNFWICIEGRSENHIAHVWAEYEYRRRCHFALELLLAALTTSLGEFEEASIAQIVSNWIDVFELSTFIGEVWPGAASVWTESATEGLNSVPAQLFANADMPTIQLRQLTPANQALAAIAILAATANQTRTIRNDGHFDQRTSAPGERAIDIIETANTEPFSQLLERLLELSALAHLQTTLRKMGEGQKCSLRFFPDGPLLRATGIGMSPGQSNDRLTNVLRILADIGELSREDGKFAPSNGVAA
jgi:hypothetical protein